MLRRLLFAEQGLLQARERSGMLLALALALVLALAGFVLAARPVLVCVAIALVGSAWRLGALVAGGIVAIPRTSRSGYRRVAGRRTRGQRRPTPRPRRGHRRAGLGVLHDQAKSSPDEGPEQRTHDHQMLAATAKRSVHRASKVEHNPDNVANARRAKPRELDLALSADQLAATEVRCLAAWTPSSSARTTSLNPAKEGCRLRRGQVANHLGAEQRPRFEAGAGCRTPQAPPASMREG